MENKYNNKRENNEDFFSKTVNQQNLFEYFGPISKGRLQQRKNKNNKTLTIKVLS